MEKVIKNSKYWFSIHVKQTVRVGCRRSETNITGVRKSVDEGLEPSIRQYVLEMDIPRSTLHPILIKDLQLHANKMQLVQ